jgi:hypothetical protein
MVERKIGLRPETGDLRETGAEVFSQASSLGSQAFPLNRQGKPGPKFFLKPQASGLKPFR